MALFKKKPRSSLYESRDQEKRAEELVRRIPELAPFLLPTPGIDYEKLEIEYQEREELRRRTQAINKCSLEQAGVNVTLFTKEKAVIDAKQLVSEFSPIAENLKTSFDEATVYVMYEPLSPTGKVPKNVVAAMIDSPENRKVVSDFGYEYSETGDNIICHIKYLRDGCINMMDYNLWHDHIRHGISVRNISGRLYITKVVRSDLKSVDEKVLFSVKKPVDNEEAKRVIDASMRALLKR